MLPIAVLLGGFATRLGELTKGKPKALIKIDGKPFIDFQLNLLKKNGYKKIVFCVSYKSKQIQDYIGDGSKFGLNIQYSFDGDTQLGTGGAIQNALGLLGEEFAVIYGDSYLPIKFAQVERFFKSSSALAVMVVYKNEDRFDVSNVKFKSKYQIEYCKSYQSSDMSYIDYGITYFRATAFEQNRLGTSYDLAELCQNLSKQNNIEGFEVYDRFYEIGSTNGIKEFSNYLRKA